MKKIKNIFIEGPISPSFVAESIAKHTVKTNIGGHSIFLGQIREEMINDQKIQSMEFTAYQEMALQKAHDIREEIISKYKLICAHIYHSLGNIKIGEICFFVFTSAEHRKEAISACDEMVDRIKKEIPLWGKEILEDQSHTWKENR
ncbi:molybdenum cofactor biosynthesis protein MoaE [Chryseobacterium sediminis]|uniref:Molybdopterin synthase catalytic subunit n=1 Tax=Chryseobacterium sediminis TaxID=1679494 RepID=A0A5B2UB34_9FLAO|nr:molybdenum cofactor biosynthesis protein MoaE [Chryseobacterium sediminis]KAA2223834.1 molybdenum cofactor biosynthesis protein MoaE [Chryseobacterium sediminis]MBB6330914.1 molybdopterin synthase catalytic subunit [Chryseobacterium sediminis]